MALTILEHSKLAQDPLTEAVMEEFARQSPILQFLPFQNILGGGVHYNKEAVLPGVGFRGINEPYPESTGEVNPNSEALKICGGDLDVDMFLASTGGENSRSVQEAMKIKALALNFARIVFKGDASINPREFDGLQRRLTGTQLVTNVAAGGPLSLNALDQLIDRVDGPMALAMNKTMRGRLTAAARNTAVGGFVTQEFNSFGQQITRYQNLPIIEMDEDNLRNQILPFNETSPDGSTAASTSIYCLSMGDMAMTGIQGAVNGVYGMSVRDLGEIETKPALRTRIEWYASIVLYTTKCAARLYGITNAAVTV